MAIIAIRQGTTYRAAYLQEAPPGILTFLIDQFHGTPEKALRLVETGGAAVARPGVTADGGFYFKHANLTLHQLFDLAERSGQYLYVYAEGVWVGAFKANHWQFMPLPLLTMIHILRVSLDPRGWARDITDGYLPIWSWRYKSAYWFPSDALLAQWLKCSENVL